jgi:hypothetical protein
MTDSDNPLRFSIENGRLYQDSEEHGVREVIQVKRMDGGGIDFLEIWVSGDQVFAGHSVGNPNFTFTVTPEGHPEGKWPGGYDYAWVLAEPEAELEDVILDPFAPLETKDYTMAEPQGV